jgi:hypothetical protein
MPMLMRAARVHVHVLVGKEMEPEYLEVLDANGGVSFKPLQEQMIRRCYKLSGIAVVDEPTEKPAYQKLATYNPVLRAGQHVYLRAEPTGEQGRAAVGFPQSVYCPTHRQHVVLMVWQGQCAALLLM